MRILVVEDERIVRTVICRVLERAGYEATEAETAAEAVASAGASARIDLIVVDRYLRPELGMDVARRVQQSHPAARILITSGLPRPQDEETNEPGTAFLAKPFSPRELLEAVRRVMGE